MTDIIDIIVIIEALAVLPLAFLALLTVKHLSDAADFASKEDWLFRAVRRIVYYLTFITLYLIVLAVISTFGEPLSVRFPWVRALNGALFLGIVGCAGYLGVEIRRHREG